jgi:hypothetical protein
MIGGMGMATFRAKKRGCLYIDGVNVPFDKGVNVTALAEMIPIGVLKGLTRDHVWEDVTVEIKEAQDVLDKKVKAVEKAKKAKVKK